MKLDYLKGKSLLELIVELPKFEWKLNDGIRLIKTQINMLMFVYYQSIKPRDDVDLYNHVDTSKGITLKDLSFIEKEKQRFVGLISKVQLGQPFEEYEHRFAHIPMMDFDMDYDFSFMNEKEKLELIKKNIKESTEIDAGVILRSGPKQNYHFIGIGRLLSATDLITFIGLALGMHYKKDGRKINLADSRHLGHALSPMKYMAQVENDFEPDAHWSSYFFADRFITLRITPKKGYETFPTVIDVLK